MKDINRRNPKSKFLNPKQIQNSNVKIEKMFEYFCLGFRV